MQNIPCHCIEGLFHLNVWSLVPVRSPQTHDLQEPRRSAATPGLPLATHATTCSRVAFLSLLDLNSKSNNSLVLPNPAVCVQIECRSWAIKRSRSHVLIHSRQMCPGRFAQSYFQCLLPVITLGRSTAPKSQAVRQGLATTILPVHSQNVASLRHHWPRGGTSSIWHVSTRDACSRSAS